MKMDRSECLLRVFPPSPEPSDLPDGKPRRGSVKQRVTTTWSSFSLLANHVCLNPLNIESFLRSSLPSCSWSFQFLQIPRYYKSKGNTEMFAIDSYSLSLSNQVRHFGLAGRKMSGPLAGLIEARCFRGRRPQTQVHTKWNLRRNDTRAALCSPVGAEP